MATTAGGVWLTPTYAFIAAFVVALAIIWLAA